MQNEKVFNQLNLISQELSDYGVDLSDENNEFSLEINDGSEAVDLAIQMARVYTGRPEVVALYKGYHGLQGYAAGLTAIGKSTQKCYSSMYSSIFHTEANDISQLENLIKYNKLGPEMRREKLPPLCLDIEVASICDLACPFCFREFVATPDKIINEELTQEIKSNNELIKNVDLENIVYYKSSILVKNTEEEYLISGGRNINLEKNDLILNEEGFVVGYVVKIFDDHSLINTIINTEFSIPGIDKYGNQYLITSNREELLVNSIAVEEINLNIDYISTDVAFNHLAKFPIVKLSNVEISNANNKISAIVDINYTFNFDSNIYIVKDK